MNAPSRPHLDDRTTGRGSRSEALKQIRLAWNINGHPGYGDWLPDTPENRELLQIQIQAGRRFGPHSMESRHSPPASSV
jgi:hypothetical protein